jgi:uncharacterized protein
MGAAKGTCPICDKPSAQAAAPFCSRRCKDVDLNRWLSGAYAIPGAEDDSEGASSQEGHDQEPEQSRRLDG